MLRPGHVPTAARGAKRRSVSSLLQCDASHMARLGGCNLWGSQYRHARVLPPRPIYACATANLALAACLGGCPRNGSDTQGPEDDGTAVPNVAGSLPNHKTAGDALSTPTMQHVELVRITRNFGKSNFEIALDAWTPVDNPREIADVRLWWAVADRDGERGPFSAKSRDSLEIEYERIDSGNWRVDLGSDKHVFRFWVGYDGSGAPAAFADVDTPEGRVEHCHVTRGQLTARKIFGAPVGIRDFEVECVDAEGAQRSGKMVDQEG